LRIEDRVSKGSLPTCFTCRTSRQGSIPNTSPRSSILDPRSSEILDPRFFSSGQEQELAVLKILDPGIYTLVVDFGRPASRSLGVSVGGAADRLSLTLGNALVGNPPEAAALEINLHGPTLTADCPLACVLCGAPFAVHSNRQQLATGKTLTLTPGEILRIGGTSRGARAYFCVAGGIQAPLVLGSRSSFEPVPAGMELPCSPGTIHHRWLRLPADLDPLLEYLHGPSTAAVSLRVLDGAQADWFDRNDLCGNEHERPVFAVSAASNRMGLRLQGPPLRLPDRELISEPVCPGSVQVTRDGQCIILGVDGQTIGGYPKAAQVISADLDLVGQLRPGDRVTFTRVELNAAETLYRRKQAELQRWVTRLHEAERFAVPAPGPNGADRTGRLPP
jgi:biotin-dependent carboxylase-like uncharacterized protein